jgi:ankyrin repeat protein
LGLKKNQATALMKATVLGSYHELGPYLERKASVIRHLLRAGANPHKKDKYGGSPWEVAIYQDHEELIRPYEEAEVQGVKEAKLQVAIASGDAARVDLLLKEGVDPGHLDSDGWSALSEASLAGNPEILTSVLKSGVNVNLRHSKGWSALMVASSASCEQCVKVLLKAGANVNHQSDDHLTALSIAIGKGKLAIIEILKQAGAKQ